MLKSGQHLLLIVFVIIFGCTSEQPKLEKFDDEGSFLVYRRQSRIGEETFSIQSTADKVIVKSLQGENERGRISGVVAELQLAADLTPLSYENIRIANDDTTNILKVVSSEGSLNIWEKKMPPVEVEKPAKFFPLNSNIPAAMEMMLYHYYFHNGSQPIPTFPRGEITLSFKGDDIITINGEEESLRRYVVEGINWGGRTVWVDANNNLIALVKANTQIREVIRKGYEEALPLFIAGNVEEQMAALAEYTEDLKSPLPPVTALVGANIIDGINDETQTGMTIIIENSIIKEIGKQSDVAIPADAKIVDLTGKTLSPGLWDMHGHSNQVQWAPAYLAGGVTTIRDNGNEIEFATAFRDAIAKGGAMGPDILLAGMTDGAGVKGNGIIRARDSEEALEVVRLYDSLGYNQIKIYTSIEPDILKTVAAEAHERGLSVTGHVPRAVGNAIDAVNSGMDMLSHRGLFLTVLFPDNKELNYRGQYLTKNEISQEQINWAIEFLLENKTVLDPTIGLDLVRGLPAGTPIESVEPDAGRIAYELFEGKRFRNGISTERATLAKQDYMKAMEIIGQFYKAGIPIVAGTDNVVPVFSLYLEIETYQKLGNLTPFEAIQTATIIPARAMGFGNKTGSLEVGKEADIAILDKNPLENIENIRSVSAVVSNGNYYQSRPLWLAADFKPERE